MKIFYDFLNNNKINQERKNNYLFEDVHSSWKCYSWMLRWGKVFCKINIKLIA